MKNLKLSSSTIEFLASIIVGDDYKRRSGPQLVKFFNGFGSKDSYPFQDSRLKYTIAKLGEYNDTCQIVKIINEVFHPVHFKGFFTQSRENFDGLAEIHPTPCFYGQS